jgi:hypothetical protein
MTLNVKHQCFNENHCFMSDSETLTSKYKAELLQRQHALQAEAEMVLEELGLIRLLSPLGSPVLLGSAAFGLMVWPDIDVTISSPGLTIDQALETMRPVYTHPRIKRVRYSNEAGSFNQTGLELHDRYYFGVYYQASTGTEWKVDISFWLSIGEHPEPVYEAVARQLTEETRVAILWLKDVWYRLPTYRKQIYSVDIYDAVLVHGVRSPTEFDEYLIKRGRPAR